MNTNISNALISKHTVIALASMKRSTVLGLFGLFLFAIFGWVDVVNNDISILLMLSAAFIQYREVYRVMRHEPLMYLFFIFAFYVILSGYYSSSVLPETKDAQWEAVGKWLRIWFFLLIAWWLDGNTRRIIIVWILAYIGFTAQIFTSFDWANWDSIFTNERQSLGLNLNATTLISGIGVIALFITLPKAIHLFRYSYKKLIGLTAAYSIALIILIKSMLLTQSRTAWIAVVVTLIFSSIYFISRQNHIKTQKYTLLIMFSIVSVITLFTFTQQDKLSSRFYNESKLVHSVINDFQLEKIPYSSFGRRLHLLHFGFNRWLEKPFFGWGPGTIITKHIQTTQYKTKFEKIEAERLHSHPHVHNTYLTTLVRLGIIGGFIILAAFVIFSQNILREYKDGNIDRFILFFYIASLITFLIANLTMFRLFSQEDQALIYLIFGSIYSYRLASLKRVYS